MLDLTTLCGNQGIKRRLAGARGLSHAYILSGPAECGKRTLAGALAAAFVCTSEDTLPCGSCIGCRKARQGHHPDISRIGDDDKAVTVAKIRALRTDAYIRPNEALRKVYIVEHGETMNASAQNALLKLLEDGPAYAAFLLLTENAGALLETVRSRCELITLAPVTVAESQAYLCTRFPSLPTEQIQEAARDCEGILGRAVTQLEGCDEGTAKLHADAVQLKTLLLGRSERTLLEHCVTLEGKDRETLARLFEETVQVLHEGLVAGEDPKRALKLIGILKQLHTALNYNTGTGHVVGALCAATFY